VTFIVIYPAAPAKAVFTRSLRLIWACPIGPLIRSLQLIQAFGLPYRAALGAGSELVVLVFEQDVERGERSVTARDILLQVELVRIA
jgi:hypothetical protein